jgi:hypothetical protein
MVAGPVTSSPLVPVGGGQGGVAAGPIGGGTVRPLSDDWVYSDFHGQWIQFRDSSYVGKYPVPVKVIQTCNSDGTDCSMHIPSDSFANYWPQRHVLFLANTIFKNSGGLVKFEFDDPDDLETFIHDDYLNNDCVPNASIVPETITDRSFDPNLICDRVSVVAARNALALSYPGRLVVFPRRNKIAAVYDEAGGHWKIGYSSDGYKQDHYIAADMMSGNNGDGTISDSRGVVFAHEAGHYLGLPHTFDEEPASVAAVAAMMEEHVADAGYEDLSNVYLATRIFDGDNLSDPEYPVPPILDTLPDPGRPVYRNTFGSTCSNSILVVPIDYQVGGDVFSQTFFFNPDQQNVMSYFFCGGYDELHYSAHQVLRMEYVLTMGSRAHLTHRDGVRSSCYGRGAHDDDGMGRSDASALAYKLARRLECLKLYDPASDFFPLGTIRQLELELALAELELPGAHRKSLRKAARAGMGKGAGQREVGEALRRQRLARKQATALAAELGAASPVAAYWTSRTADHGLDLEDASFAR